jgi:hypothetical protein
MGIQYVPYKWLEVLARKALARWGCPSVSGRYPLSSSANSSRATPNAGNAIRIWRRYWSPSSDPRVPGRIKRRLIRSHITHTRRVAPSHGQGTCKQDKRTHHYLNHN